MALRDKIAQAATPYLQPGEQIQASFAAVATSPYWSLLSYWIILVKDSNRAVIATDRRIFVARTSRMRFTKFKGIEAEFPRSTMLGEPSGINWKCEALGPTLWIHKRFHKDVRELQGVVR